MTSMGRFQLWLLLGYTGAACCPTAASPHVMKPAATASIPSDESAQPEQTTDPSALKFTIESPGDKNAIRMRLVNVSKQSLWVNARMLVGSVIGEVSLEVAPSERARLPEADCRVHPNPAHYTLLEPGSEIAVVVTSLGCLEFPAEGPWHLTATYRDKRSRVPKPPNGAVWFRGTLTSNELEFRATPAQ